MKKRLNAENFAQFKVIVKSYSKVHDEANYNKTVLGLRKVFPDSSSQDLFIRKYEK